MLVAGEWRRSRGEPGLGEVTLEGLKRIFGQAEGYAPWLEEWLPAALGPLIERGYTLQEILPFVSDGRFREAVLSELGDREKALYRRCFAELEELRDFNAALRLAPVRTRAKLPEGTEVEIVERRPGWLKIRLADDARTAWVREGSVEVVGI